jgi:hypothetical protein
VELKEIRNFRLIDRNKAAAEVTFLVDGADCETELIYYLQSDYCLSIRVGRKRTDSLSYEQIEDYLHEHRVELKKQIKPEVERVRRESREALLRQVENDGDF